ncbi:type II toxin-antitoxin system HicA family toxin [Escherichia coli]|uniref:type II toxin-antitoxin system HicA family toxin n=2 Tax=Escherichia coli TaxID=562 RepID=UPI000A18484D|nr:type II toxin-antitoxin system HicA family toxin [Escherichia coli]EFH8163200.1 addiction module toxin, HicA family [Escherichia coli]EKG7113478.1 type II toxin-antitoxin system HicA family toxin [Escherichia coli]EKI3096575.1 type II toxin-antitoxin system HicA family toxin [Escherichia coli]EKR4920322.1 type II toxin-antitoxin system HicA family toxin [Escherichia coli]ELM8776573.1 type II toxin-antitoxin system HicA family toxin [Escherichia coli]
MTSTEVMKMLREHGWVLARVKGSHHTFTKEGVPCIITVPHPEKDIANGTLAKILKQMKL